MEIELIHDILELYLPFLQILGIITIDLLQLEVGADKLNACGRSKDLLLWLVLGPDDLEDGVEGDHESSLAGLAVHRMVEDCLWSEDENNRMRAIGLEEESGGEDWVG